MGCGPAFKREILNEPDDKPPQSSSDPTCRAIVCTTFTRLSTRRSDLTRVRPLRSDKTGRRPLRAKAP